MRSVLMQDDPSEGSEVAHCNVERSETVGSRAKAAKGPEMWPLFIGRGNAGMPKMTRLAKGSEMGPFLDGITPGRCVWVQGWSEPHSQSYGVSEAQAQACLNKLARQKWPHFRALIKKGRLAPP